MDRAGRPSHDRGAARHGGPVDDKPGPSGKFLPPSVDALFRSAAELYGPHVLWVVMTGMGADGVRGAQRIREGGSEVFVQDEASSVVWGMPGQVAVQGEADGIYVLDLLGIEVARRVKQSRSLTATVQGKEKQGAIS